MHVASGNDAAKRPWVVRPGLREDDTGQERYEGDGVIYAVYVNDIENFDNPSIDWEARGPAAEIVVTIDGDRVTADGVFEDLLTELEVEQVPGTLHAICGSQSIR